MEILIFGSAFDLQLSTVKKMKSKFLSMNLMRHIITPTYYHLSYLSYHLIKRKHNQQTFYTILSLTVFSICTTEQMLDPATHAVIRSRDLSIIKYIWDSIFGP